MVAALIWAGLASGAAVRRVSTRGATVIIRYTPYGIPHIQATTYEGAGLGYGYGSPSRKDNLCTIADELRDGRRPALDVLRAERHLSTSTGNGIVRRTSTRTSSSSRCIDSGVMQQAVLAVPPPTGVGQPVRQLIEGYVQGYNRYLASVGGSKGVPDSSLPGQAVGPPDHHRQNVISVLLSC